MRGMEFLETCITGDIPPMFVKVNQRSRGIPRQRRSDLTPPKRKRDNDRRSSSDKTGQGSRRKQREAILRTYGAVCHICLARGVTDHRAIIDLTLTWPHEMCFTRDHLIPRSQGGKDDITNLRPAHHACNRNRADGPVAA